MDMDMKLIVIVATIILTVADCNGKAALRRKPKVYNALITTDEDLVQSRAYPVIQPTLHESGIAHYGSYGPYNPYGIYNPHVVRLAQPIAPALAPKEQLPYPLPPVEFPPQVMRQSLGPQPVDGFPLPQSPPTAPGAAKSQTALIPPTGLEEQPQPTVQSPTIAPSQLPKSKMPSEQLPIPLNQYGLPPSLIPLRQPQLYPPHPYPYASTNGAQPFHLPPYRFNQIPPLYYNTLPGLRQQFLPPYDYLPTGPQFPLSNIIPSEKAYPTEPPSQPLPVPTVAPTPSPLTTADEQTESSITSTESLPSQPSFENIKNGSKSRDSDVPDVPPPPIPSGAKSKQS